ncbi:collagen alpha-4(VI) chain-like [Ruditapes philippinarum]|uniref:collagen alpha-4(VI) chain-like n=1 Tax=Ruditapes philippinarum TaxID=129788 RepID=UPI00295AAB52|nr:collagen alpha-4(VI) chain-like [Ruditapes philippinarum]
MEIFFLLDSSGSIGQTHFSQVKDFVWNVSQVLDIAQSKTRVGLMTFSRFPIIRLSIVDTENKTQVLDDIKSVPYVPGLTETHTALSLLQREGYFGSRSNIPHVAMLITEGKSLHTKDTSDAAASLHSHGIQVFVVGIGHNVASTELHTIASDPDSGHLLTVETYKELPSIIEKLTTLTCDVSAHSYTPMTTPKPILFQHTYGDPVSECIGKAADIVFVIDSTTTIGAAHFKSVKRFALDIVNDFDIADNATRIGVITFSTYPLLRLELGKLNAKLEVLNFINNLVYFTGKRETDRALELLRIEGLLNHRQETPDIAILITDGPSTSTFLTTRAADELKQSGVEVFVVGIGDKVNAQELGSISSDPKDHVFTVSNFDELGLSSFEGVVAKTICKDIPFLTTQRTTPSTTTPTQTTTHQLMTSSRSPWLISGNDTSDCVPDVKDILFLVDSSTKVGEKNFMKVKTFIKQTVGTFNIGLNQTRVGLILFNTNATLVFALDAYDTSQDIQQAVDNIVYKPANKTNTAQALEFARTQGFTYDRAGAPNIAFVITDGYSSNKTATHLQATLAKENNLIQIVTTAVGQYVDFDELVDIATENPYTNQSLFYSVDDFDDLHVMSLENVLTSVICGFQILPTSPETTTTTTTTTSHSTSTPCYDKVKNCDEYKQDMCTSYKPWAMAHCNQYCGFCQGTTTPVKICFDKIDNCHEYGPNICNSTAFRKWTKDHCSLYCGLCGPPTTTTSIPSTPKFEIPTVPPKTPMLPSSGLNSSCYNKVDNCDLYTQDMCSSYRPWAMEHCRMFCGFCIGTPTPVEHCVDTVANCNEYGADLCTSLGYRRWSKEHCPRFCGFCGKHCNYNSKRFQKTEINNLCAYEN